MSDINRSAFYVGVIILLVLVAFWSVILAFEYKNDADQATAVTQELDQLLLDYNAGVDGRACGILTKNEAETILQTTIEKDAISSRQRPGGTEVSTQDDPELFWADTCLYESTQNNNIFVGLTISTYQTTEEAQKAFETVLPAVNEAEILNRANYGDELLYDAGVVYLLKDREIYQISAQNNNPAMTREFAIITFERLVVQFE